jgi:hypothetical protein
VRRLVSIALLSLALVSAGAAHAEGAQSNANTPKLALHKTELWLAMAEPKPSIADLDAGMGVASAVEERLTMLNTELGAVTSRRRTLLAQASACRQKIAELRNAPKGENGIKASGADAKIVELEQRATSLETQAEAQHVTMLRLGEEERSLVDATGRVRGVVDMIDASSAADAKQKQKATVLAGKTNRLFKLHATIIMTVMAATQPTSS